MSETTSPTEEPLPWALLLAQHPPDKLRIVAGLGRRAESNQFILASPDLELNCESEACGGVRTFRCTQENVRAFINNWQRCYLTYECRNCQKTTKDYAFLCRWQFKAASPPPLIHTGGAHRMSAGSLAKVEPEVNITEAVKLGEWPPIGPVIPRKLLRLLGSDRELFEAGRRAEGQGMGIGAFAYYRRVVENRREDLFDKLIEAAQRLNADPSVIAGLKADRDNWQFSHSVEGLKAALPDNLKVQGHNPLSLLHTALSHNLHNESDATCLQAAHDIRLVLTFFAEQLANVLTERAELEKAVGRLTRQAPKSSALQTSAKTPPQA